MSLIVKRGPIIYSFLDDEDGVVHVRASNPDTRIAFEPIYGASAAGPFTLVMHQLVEFEVEPERHDPRQVVERQVVPFLREHAKVDEAAAVEAVIAELDRAEELLYR